MNDTLVRNLPFCQGEISACAHISVSVASVLLHGGTMVLSAPLEANQKLMKAAMQRGIEYYIWALKKRRRDSPNDCSALFSAGKVVRESDLHAIENNTIPWFASSESSGWVILRASVTDPKYPTIGGFTPRLLDEVDRIYQKAKNGVPQAMLLTSCAETRIILMRTDGLWAYDSHGTTNSTLYYFKTISALLVYLLRRCRIFDENELERNVQQLENPDLRTIDCEFDNTRKDVVEFELVVLEKA